MTMEWTASDIFDEALGRLINKSLDRNVPLQYIIDALEHEASALRSESKEEEKEIIQP